MRGLQQHGLGIESAQELQRPGGGAFVPPDACYGPVGNPAYPDGVLRLRPPRLCQNESL